MGREWAPQGLVSPMYGVLRSQLECYWNIAYLTKDPSTKDPSTFGEKSAAYYYYHTQTVVRHNIRTLKGMNLSHPKKVEEEKRQRKLRQNLDNDPRYTHLVKTYMERSKSKSGQQLFPPWYTAFLGQKASIGDLADACGDRRTYDLQYGLWSAIVHGSTPTLGPETNDSTPIGTKALGANVEQIVWLSNRAFKQGQDTYRAVIRIVAPQQERAFEQLTISIREKHGVNPAL